tara:strand:- start:728 stop:1342 length:615 start_codon:yes stop_codon:yes gene_type:complete
MKKVNSIKLTELQTKRALRLLSDLILYYELHCQGNETKEELKVITQSCNLEKLLEKKLKTIKDKRYKKAMKAIEKKFKEEEKETEKRDKERYKKTMLERKEMFSYESIELFLKAKYPDLKKAMELEEWEDDEYKIKNIYPRVADTFKVILDFEKEEEKEGRMKLYNYNSIEFLLDAARNSITRQIWIDKGFAYEDENGQLIHIK